TANRFWQQLFGTGLVKTSFDFGTQGELPSHPELLDWLATTFASPSLSKGGRGGSGELAIGATETNHATPPAPPFLRGGEAGVGGAGWGWAVKARVGMRVTWAAFRRDARPPSGLQKRDPENRLYARGPRFRLDAEQVRDNALFVSGLIDLKMGGRGVRTYQPA